MAPLVLEIEKHEQLESIVTVTAQHREMLDQVLEVFDIKPDYDLNLMKKGQTLASITIDALKKLNDIISAEKPDLVLVHGDTTTTFVGALASFYSQVRVGHVEAGLRTFDIYAPYPEEMNRLLTGRLASIHFAPTNKARENLLNEGIDESNVFVTGNTVIDALSTTIRDDYTFKCDGLNKIDKSKKVITMTAHRRENLGQPLERICEAVDELTKQFDDILVIYPVHLNPLVQDTAKKILGDNKNVLLIEPLELLDMHNLLNRSYFVMTDSGGLQEEVPALGKPVLVLRDVTERPEGVEAGTLKLVGTNKELIIKEAATLLNDRNEYDKMAKANNPYGDGTASKKIVQAILNIKR